MLDRGTAGPLDQLVVRELLDDITVQPGDALTVDLVDQRIVLPDSSSLEFAVAPFQRQRLEVRRPLGRQTWPSWRAHATA